MGWDELSFKEKIEQEHTFPGTYLFKFIVPQNQRDRLIEILPDGELSIKESSAGKYVSISLMQVMMSSEEVLAVYREVHTIEGIIAL